MDATAIAALISAGVAALALAGAWIGLWRKGRRERTASLSAGQSSYSDQETFAGPTDPGRYNVFIKNFGPAQAHDISATLRDGDGRVVLTAPKTVASLGGGEQYRFTFEVPTDLKGASLSLRVSYTDGAGEHDKSMLEVELS